MMETLTKSKNLAIHQNDETGAVDKTARLLSLITMDTDFSNEPQNEQIEKLILAGASGKSDGARKGRKWEIDPEVPEKTLDQSFIFCFGDFEVFLKNNIHSPVKWRTTKAREMFAYFIHQRGRPVLLQEALSDLWPGVLPAQAATFFHTHLYHVRQILKSTGRKSDIFYKNGEYMIHLEKTSCDMVVYDNLVKEAGFEEEDEVKRNIQYIERAIALYRGDYMGHFAWEWVLPRREEYSQQYIKLLRSVANYYMKLKLYQPAIDILRKTLQVNPFLEEIHILLMRAQSEMGDRQAVIRQYQNLRKLLIDELGVEPNIFTKKLYYEMLG